MRWEGVSLVCGIFVCVCVCVYVCVRIFRFF